MPQAFHVAQECDLVAIRAAEDNTVAERPAEYGLEPYGLRNKLQKENGNAT